MTMWRNLPKYIKIDKGTLSPVSEASREVANLTERKNTHPPIVISPKEGLKELSL